MMSTLALSLHNLERERSLEQDGKGLTAEPFRLAVLHGRTRQQLARDPSSFPGVAPRVIRRCDERCRAKAACAQSRLMPSDIAARDERLIAQAAG
jgi:hypothetical protein